MEQASSQAGTNLNAQLVCSICGISGIHLYAVRALSAEMFSLGLEARQPAELFTLTNLGGEVLYQGMPNRNASLGPISFQILAAHLYNQGLLPEGSIILNGGKVAEKDEIVYAEAGTNSACLTIVRDTYALEQDKYAVMRPSALNPLPDNPCATVYTNRILTVHSTARSSVETTNFIDALLCEECRKVYGDAFDGD